MEAFHPGSDGGLEILSAVAAARSEIGYIAKVQENKFHGYQFRGIDDALNHIGPVLNKVGITPVPEFGDYKFDIVNFTKKNGNQVSMVIVNVRLDWYLICNADGSWVRYRTYGEARDETDDKATAKAESAAFKIAAFLGLMVPAAPDMLEDSDREPPSDENMAASRATSALKAEDEGKNRSEIFNKAKNKITESGKAGNADSLKKFSIAVDKTAGFSSEEKAALHRLIATFLNEISDNHRRTSGTESK